MGTVSIAIFSPDGSRLVSLGGNGVKVRDTMPIRVREKRRREARARRARAEPVVDRLFDDLGEWSEVAEHLREDDTLANDFRRAALKVVMRRALEARR